MLSITDGDAGQLCGEGEQRMQSGQKSPALLFHDMAEMLIFKGRRVSRSLNKLEVISQLQAELELSRTNVGNGEEQLTANLWDTTIGPRSLRYVHNATPPPFPPGWGCRPSRRCWDALRAVSQHRAVSICSQG